MSGKQLNQDIRGFYGKHSKQSRASDERNVGRERQPTQGTSSSSGGAIGHGGCAKPQTKKQRLSRLSTEEIQGLMEESQSQPTDFLEEPSHEVTLLCDELDVVDTLDNLGSDFDAGVSVSVSQSHHSREEEEAEIEALEGIEPDEAARSTFSEGDAAYGLKILEESLAGVGW